MRWNCPHCGTNLAVADDKVGTGWSFSRCYKCGGFALIRRSDVNLIKVDRAPAGEPVLLPEAHENPTALLSQTATNNLARYTGAASAKAAQASQQKQNSAVQIAPAHVSAAAEALAAAHRGQSEAKPVIRTAARRIKQQLHQQQPQAPALLSVPSAVTAAQESNGLGLPEPLPDQPATGILQRLVPIAIGMTGMLAIGSGVYLYIQGQALWEKSRSQSAEMASAQAEPEHESAPAGNEIVQVPSITPEAPAAAAAAAAPLKPASPSAGSANISKPTTVASAGSSESPRNEVMDQVHANAMAPARNVVEPDAEKSLIIKMKVEVMGNSAHIHSGPGMEYPVIGTANNHTKYAVEEWRDRWFKISLENPAAKEQGQPDGAQKKTAWIRNDQVRLAP